MLGQALDYVRHLDVHIAELIRQYGTWVYAILAGIIFAETAFVIFPFLPGDSLLFALGVIAVDDGSNLNWGATYLLLTGAAVLGNVVNYHIGRLFGKKLFDRPNSKIFTPANLAKTHAFYEKYGSKTIVITRFVPVIRAFAPFIAGMGAMTFPQFMLYNVIGGALWVGVCMGAGSLLGSIPAVKENFELAILGLVVISVLPIIVEVILHKRKHKNVIAVTDEDQLALAETSPESK